MKNKYPEWFLEIKRLYLTQQKIKGRCPNCGKALLKDRKSKRCIDDLCGYVIYY